VAATSTEANRRRISLLEPDSFVSEQFRVLRSRIDSIAAQRPLRTVVVTSANAGEGKSNVSINLAVVTAMSVGRQVLLVDCDLRRPMIHRSLGLEPRVGLADVLMDRATLDDAVLKLGGVNLDILAVRSLPENPSELLASTQMRSLIEETSRRYDRTILDTPATLGLPDSKILSEIADGLVMVVRAGVTPREDVQSALDVLDRRRILGMVLNGAEQGHERYGYY
jgi:capsular exopolysaccharide synthesis family protein